MFNLPFTENKVNDNVVIREFQEGIDSDEMKWHWDREDRIVKVLEDTDWQFQMDNQLPIQMKKDVEIFIPKGSWHRVIKKYGNLVVKITKLY